MTMNVWSALVLIVFFGGVLGSVGGFDWIPRAIDAWRGKHEQ